MIIVAGLSLKNLQPDVWNPDSPYYIPHLRAIMVSYGDFHQMPKQLAKAKQIGLRKYLNVPDDIAIYLDNGAFYFLRSGEDASRESYQAFVEAAKPDWYPVAFDVIPTPQMSQAKQRYCLDATMSANRAYQHDGYVPVIHVSRLLNEYVKAVKRSPKLATKEQIALGGMVPNLLRASKALSYGTILKNLLHVRSKFGDKNLHVFGIGGTATLHLAALLEIESADSSGWRNRAARGIVQLPGRGDRVVANLGNWRGREPDTEEWVKLKRCRCPACLENGIKGIKASGLTGFCNRATHNLWVLLDEARWLDKHLKADTYERNYKRRLNNSTYLPLLTQLLQLKKNEQRSNTKDLIRSRL
jgi:7-cyano-7-deazaguanine tRNA-ribosyltransferase